MPRRPLRDPTVPGPWLPARAPRTPRRAWPPPGRLSPGRRCCARRPKPPGRPPRRFRRRAGSFPGQLRFDRLQQLLPGGGELRHALLLEDGDHVVVADADGLQILEDLPGLLVGAPDGVTAHLAVVGHGENRRL